VLGSRADGSAQTVGGGYSSEVKRATHRSNIVAASAWETKSEGHAAEQQKDLKQVGGEGVGNPTTSQGYPGLSGRYAWERVQESSQSVGWGSTSRCMEVDHGGSHGSLEAYLHS